MSAVSRIRFLYRGKDGRIVHGEDHEIEAFGGVFPNVGDTLLFPIKYENQEEQGYGYYEVVKRYIFVSYELPHLVIELEEHKEDEYPPAFYLKR